MRNIRIFWCFLLLFALSICLKSAMGGERTGPENFTFAVISDSHLCMENGKSSLYPYTEKIITTLTESCKPDFVIDCGDMTTCQGRESGEELRAQWQVFARGVRDRLAAKNILFFPVRGNNEDRGRGNEVYKSFWQAHVNRGIVLDSGTYAGNYAFHYGNSLFVALDRASMTSEEKELRWLEGVLKKYAGAYRHTFVFCHMGLLGTEDKLLDSPAEQRLQQMLRHYRVEYFISGHYHMSFELEVGPTMYVIAGSAGATYPYDYLLFQVRGDRVDWKVLSPLD